MAINSNQIVNLLVEKKTNSSVISLILEYAVIKQKLEKPDIQSWYFRQALQEKYQKMSLLTKDYEAIRSWYNKVTVDYFIHEIHQNNILISSYKAEGINSIKYMATTTLVNHNKFLAELIKLKSKTELLMPIDYYVQNPDRFLEIMDQ